MVKVPPVLGAVVVEVGLAVVVVEVGAVVVAVAVEVAVEVGGAEVVLVGVVEEAGLPHPRRMKARTKTRARKTVIFFIQVTSLNIF